MRDKEMGGGCGKRVNKDTSKCILLSKIKTTKTYDHQTWHNHMDTVSRTRTHTSRNMFYIFVFLDYKFKAYCPLTEHLK